MVKKGAEKKTKKGSRYTCRACSLVVTIDKTCGCIETCDITCCGEEMKPKL